MLHYYTSHTSALHALSFTQTAMLAKPAIMCCCCRSESFTGISLFSFLPANLQGLSVNHRD